MVLHRAGAQEQGLRDLVVVAARGDAAARRKSSGIGSRPHEPSVFGSLHVGLRVLHKAEAVVHFKSVGEKKLLLAWSPLKRA